jgi:hypothetical protein
MPHCLLFEGVLLHDEKVRRGRSAKLCRLTLGLMRSVDDVKVTLKLPRSKTLKVHANRLKPFFVELQELIASCGSLAC